MGTFDSFYTALSGMEANSISISVVGDNLANLNTIGYKASRATFQDVLGQTLIGVTGSRRLGQGVSLQSIDQMHSQGGFQSTSSVTDLAIGGEGFFVVRDAAGADNGTYYTRAGQFRLNADGLLVTPAGHRVQGYMANANGEIGTALGDLNLNGVKWAPKATETVELGLNVPSDAEVAAEPFDPTDPATYTNQTSITVYDSLGGQSQVEVYFRKTGDGTWGWEAVQDGSAVGNGVLQFDEDGQLTDGSPGQIQITPADGAGTPQTIAVDFGAVDGTGPTTQHNSPFAITSLTQDGEAPGELSAIDVDESGVIRGAFSNGKTRDLGRVGIATFRNVQGLARKGGNLWGGTPQSGEALVGAAGESGRGIIRSATLESSNVDLTREFVNLIAAQRGFQASSRTITTVDQLLQETVNLKR